MVDDFMFYAKEDTLQECVKEPVLKTLQWESPREYGQVESRAETIPWVSAGSGAQLRELSGS